MTLFAIVPALIRKTMGLHFSRIDNPVPKKHTTSRAALRPFRFGYKPGSGPTVPSIVRRKSVIDLEKGFS